MVNPSKAKGTAWETAVVEYLRSRGHKYVERRALNGAQDKGDIAGINGVMIECKAEKTITLSTYMKEVEAQSLNAMAEVGVAWIKRRGHTSPGNGYVVMTGEQFAHLLTYLPETL